MKAVAAYKYYDAETVEEACAVLNQYAGKAKVLAGGTDLVDWMKRRFMPTPEVLVNIKKIPGLSGITEEGGALKIGATTTLTDIVENSTIQSKYKSLADAAAKGPPPPIRNMGTVAGNLCQYVRCWYYRWPDWYCYRKGGPICFAPGGRNVPHAIMEQKVCNAVVPSDLAVPLAAMNATLTVQGTGGTREVAVKDLYVVLGTVLKPDEIITSVTVPEAPTKQAFLKSRVRAGVDFALVSAAAATTSKGTTVALGGVAPIMVAGTPDAINAAIDKATPLSENRYKVSVAKAMVRRVTA
ncbi:FAD binding domain-containing protein [Candidatus Bathyarchaeota archaeon]|nr:FAD binding domain-containing protein [Candidatus Bathyarchaeota archaeon]